MQVADRFHLWQNLGKAVERCVARHRACLGAVTPEPSQPTPSPPPEEERPVGRFAERACRHHALVHDLVEQGHALRACAPNTRSPPQRGILRAADHGTDQITTGAVEMDEQAGFVVEGERVALGPLRSDLVPTYQRWENDLEVANGNGRVMPFTLEAERDRVAGRSGKPDCLDFTVYDRADQTPIGWSTLAGIDHRTGTAEFGIHLGDRRGQGFGTEATRLTLDWGFTMLGLHNIMLATAAWNQRAIRVYAKVGFRELGRRRSAGVTMGRRYDAVFMDLLASEFRQRGWSVLAGRAPHGGSANP